MAGTQTKPIKKKKDTSPQAKARRKQAWAALCALREKAGRTGISELPAGAIDAEVAAVRRKRR